MKRGVINPNDIIAYLALFVFALVLFTLFLLTKASIANTYLDVNTETNFASQHGMATLAAFLQSSYGDGTYADAIQGCVGNCTYETAVETFFSGFCTAYILQINEYRIGPGIQEHIKDKVYQGWFLSSNRKDFLVSGFTREQFKNPGASLIIGKQSMPGDIPLTLTLLCIERDGVVYT